MGKWRCLLLAMVCWMAVGYGVCGTGQDHGDNGAPLPHQAGRIVSMAPNLTEILFALGLDKEIVGVTAFSDYPPAARQKNKVGTFWQPNVEAVVAARPSLVLTLAIPGQKNLAERLSRIGYNCLIVKIDAVDELFAAIEKIGTVTGKQREADEVVNGIQRKLKALSALVETTGKVRVLWVVQREPLRVAGRNTFVNEIIEMAGGENAIGPTVYQYPPIGAEQVIACRPDVILEPDMGQQDLSAQQANALQYWSKFRNVPAVANGRVVVIPGDTVSRLGPRLYEGVEMIARCLKPDLFRN
ncbi:MAG: helical backbone metal receptor [Sedimentisphaerales bacterium]|jgi:iron complex transport system substrate-binding protein